ncbi:MAG: exodeoxyribonuclease V subunit beta [Neisseria sp.]|nr:exodeoxyribonuclease V subunit beta [Neisseria sp.]
MTPAQPFNPLTIAISGTNLIEASAGTGKTYGIAALFTRLIVLEKLPVEAVLVVTFTKAATAELKNRLRARLDDALGVLLEFEPMPSETWAHPFDADALAALFRQHSGKPAPDAFIFALLAQALAAESLPRLIVRLKAAIGDFDNAAIFTIHGFCQRLLRDYAFLCQVPFDTELTDDNDGRLLTPAQDFWRTQVAGDEQKARLVFKHKLTPAAVLAEMRPFLSRPYLHFRRPQTDLPQAQQDVQQNWQSLIPKLSDLAETFWQIHPALNGNSYRKTTFEPLFAELQAAADAGRLPDNPENRLAKFAAAELAAKLKKGQSPDSAAFAKLQSLADLGRDLAALTAAEADALITLQLDFLAYLEAALAEQKKSRRERSYDDLLLDVYHALTGSPQRGKLADIIAANWRVALIDEFQDTDPLQYEIFRRIFIERGNPLFLVGDPKQAIYSFRGADIYAYLQAAADADQRYTLTANYRSHAALVDGVGSLFCLKQRPFVLPQIGYPQVHAARADSRLEPPQTPIRVRWIDDNDTILNKEALRRRAAEYCADEIAAALNEAAQGRLNVGGVPLRSGDIAVLVRTHNEGSLVAQALKARHVQSVLLRRESVFATPEAAALAALIGFWLQPQRTEPLRFVLGGVLFQQSAAELYALNQDEAALSGWIASAEAAAAQWRQHGFYAAMQQFVARHGIETRLLAAANERSLTNYHQILEKLAEEDEQSHTPASLHQWLLAQIQTATQGHSNEAHQLRLESDEALVKIVTMHAAKGLQYPLVYCPFVWDAPDNKPDNWQILHRAGGRSELLAKAQLDEADLGQLADEEAAERLRLLYVALTRAEEQLTLYAAHCNHTAANTFAYLLEGGSRSSRSETEAAYAAEKKTAKAEGEKAMLRRNWLRFIEHAPAFAFVEAAPAGAVSHAARLADGHYQAADIPARPFAFIRHTSFTGLSRHTKTPNDGAEELQPAIDPAEAATFPERPSESAASSATDDIHHFPRGAHAGVCLHELLENFDFNSPAACQQQAVAATLARYGFDAQWLPAVTAMLDHTRLTSLSGGHSLADQPAARRLPEMAFTLHMHDFGLERLRQWFAQTRSTLPAACIEAAQWLDFQDVAGYLNGFIDMICQDADGRVCIIDYKSNHLGNSPADYNTDAMNEAMAEHHYYLQALIYAIAAARYFALRGQTLPTVCVRYLFLRGLDGSGNGVWQWDIDTADLADWL